MSVVRRYGKKKNMGQHLFVYSRYSEPSESEHAKSEIGTLRFSVVLSYMFMCFPWLVFDLSSISQVKNRKTQASVNFDVFLMHKIEYIFVACVQMI